MGWLHLKYMIMPSIISTLKQTKTIAAMVAGGYAGCRGGSMRRCERAREAMWGGGHFSVLDLHASFE